MGNQLTYGILPCSVTTVDQQQNNSINQNSSQNKSVSICIAFLPKSWRVVTGC
jgi:hypothetical protein